ncbi:hypothetical protein ACPW96_21420 [Micromonospora sp. DT81.3]|uniref:hypothetical protein n=1 Tax=Micromonospora sp. DT81.3 TaxID=3416523 RepID=UPI003CF5FA9D
MNPLSRAVLAVGIALTLTSCATAEPAAPAPSGSPTATATNPANPTPPVDDATPAPVAEAGDDSQSAAIEVAENAVAAFGRPDLPYEQWIAGLYPFLTQSGAAAYEGTDPMNVPVHAVTGPGAVLPASTEVALIVVVPTDAGPYNVSLSRPEPAAPWLADRIRPAEG